MVWRSLRGQRSSSAPPFWALVEALPVGPSDSGLPIPWLIDSSETTLTDGGRASRSPWGDAEVTGGGALPWHQGAATPGAVCEYDEIHQIPARIGPC